MRTAFIIIITMLCAVPGLGLTASAAEAPLHHASAPRPDPALSLRAVVDAAWQRMPERPVVPALEREADALQRHGAAWTAGPATLTALYRDDRLASDTGVREMDLGVSIPLWNWGQQDAAAAWAGAAGQDARLTAAALRLDLSGQVRDALWQLLITEKRLALAESSAAEAQHLLDLVEKRYQAGDVAEQDLLLAREYVQETETARLDANAQVLDARRQYAALTGLGRRPADFAEALQGAETLSPAHPALQQANGRVQRAARELDYQREASSASSSLTLGTRRERADYGARNINSAYLGISVPLGRGPAAATAIAASARRLAEAEAARNRVERELRLALHEAEHRLGVDKATLRANRERAQLSGRRAAMVARAYALGETDVFSLVQARTLAQRARLGAELTALRVQWDIARCNQAAGVMP